MERAGDVKPLLLSELYLIMPAMRSARLAHVGTMYVRAFEKKVMFVSGAKIPRSGRPICFFVARYY
jgi:hypothetical protein